MIKKLLNSKFKKDLSFSYISQAITISFGFIQIFLINRYFGVATYGQLTIIMSTAGIFSALLTARSSETITRFFTREMLNNTIRVLLDSDKVYSLHIKDKKIFDNLKIAFGKTKSIESCFISKKIIKLNRFK